MERAHHWMEALAGWLKLGFETASILVIAAGGIAVLALLFSQRPAGVWLSSIRPRLSRFLLVALELQLAADIVGTAISPNWEQLGKLAAIAAIRTFLNYFLVEEAKSEPASKQPAAG